MNTKIWILLLFGMSNACLFAQNGINDTLSEVILETQRIKIDTPSVLHTTLNASSVEHYAPTELTQVLNEVPGVQVFSGGLSTNRLTVRGIGARTPYGTSKIQAYYNGIPITSGIGETTFNIYDPESIQNIRIISGPKGTPYGANLGGAMLLYTKKGKPNTTALREGFTVGSYGLLKNSLQVSHRDADFYINFFQDHMQTDGFRDNSTYKRNTFLLDAGFTLNDKNEIQILMQQLNYNAQIPSSINKTDFDQNPARAASNWNAAKGYEDNKITTVGLSLIHKFSDQFTNKTTVFYSYLDHYEPRPFNILDEFSNSFGLRSSFLGSLNLIPLKNNFEVGFEWYRDTYHWSTFENLYEQNQGRGSLAGDRLSDNKEYRNRWNAFVNWDVFIDNWTFTAGLHLNNSSYSFRDYFNAGDANKNAKRNFDAVWAPSVTLRYKVNSKWNLHGNVSYGYNIPNLEETLTPEGVINPDIGPETGWSYEVGTHHSFFDQRFNLSLVAYQMDVENLLISDRVGEDQYIGRNAGKVTHRGLEFHADFRQSIWSRLRFNPYVNVTINHHRFKTFVSDGSDYSGNKLTGVPENTLSGGFVLRDRSGLFLQTNLQHVGQIPMNDSNTQYNGSYSVVNVKAGYKKKLLERFDFKMIFGVNNLLDEKYASSILVNAVGFGAAEPRYYYPGMPVNYYGGLVLGYSFD